MYNASENLKNALKAEAVTTTARITVLPNNTVIDGNHLCSVKITDKCYNDGVIIGTAMCKELEIEIINNNFDLADKEFSLEVGVKLPNGTYEYISYGNYIVKEYNDMKSNNKYKIIAYDYMDKLNEEFVDDYDYSNPITLQVFYERVASFYNIEIVSQELPNQNFTISTKPYFDGMTGRTVISKIAEMFGSFAKFNRNNKLQMYLKTVTEEKITRNEMNSSLQINKMFGPINVVAMRLSDIEGENVTLRDEDSIATYGENVLQIYDNPFAYTEALRRIAITGIYERVKGFSYYPTEFNFKIIYYDCGDVVEVQDMNTDNFYETIILNQSLQIPNTIRSKCQNLALTKTGLQHQFLSEEAIKNRRTEYLIDKQNQTIQQIVEKTTELEENSIYGIEVLYALSSSETQAPTEGWSATAPAWTEGKYMWQKTVTIYADGSAQESNPTNISGSKGKDGEDGEDGVDGVDGVGISSIISEYYLSTSDATQTGGTWAETQQEWEDGKYFWTRSKITWSDGTTAYTTPVLAQGINNANQSVSIVKQTVAEQKIRVDSIEQSVSTTQTIVGNNYNELKTKFDDYAPKSDVVSLQTSVEKIQTDTYTKTEINTKLTDGSVTKVLTTAGTFDENGLTIEKTNAKTKGNFNEKGITVTDATSGSDEELLFAGYDEDLGETIVRSKNMTVEKYFVISNIARQEKYTNPVLGGKGIGVFML